MFIHWSYKLSSVFHYLLRIPREFGDVLCYKVSVVSWVGEGNFSISCFSVDVEVVVGMSVVVYYMSAILLKVLHWPPFVESAE